MDGSELTLSIRSPAQIRAMHFSPTDAYLPNGIFAKGQPFGIVGPAGIGKSRLALQLAVCTLTSQPFLRWPMEKHLLKWLFVQTENGGLRLQNDINAMAAWVGEEAFREVDQYLRLRILATNHDSFLSLDDPGNTFRLNRTLAEHAPDVALFDPLIAFSAGNLNTDAGMLQTCQGLSRLATRHNPGATVVVLHHSLAGKAGIKKAAGFDAGAYARGSKAFVQWIRGQLNVAPAKEGDSTRLVIGYGKNSNGPWFEPFGIVLNRQTMVYEVDLHFDLSVWQASVGIASSTAIVRKLDKAAVGAMAGAVPKNKGKLAAVIMAEYAVAKSRAYEIIGQAEAAGLIVRDARKLY